MALKRPNRCLDLLGQRFGRLVVKEYVGKDLKSNSIWECLCDCGNIHRVTIRNLRYGTTKSCGCLWRELTKLAASRTHRTHGGSKTRLYQCWLDLRLRAISRVDCGIYPAWNKFIHFRDWSLSNGYTKDLVIGRGTEEVPDKGPYSPDNARWITLGKNTQEGRSMNYSLTSPLMEIFEGTNLSKFCRDHKLVLSCMHRVVIGERAQHKGWRNLIKGGK